MVHCMVRHRGLLTCCSGVTDRPRMSGDAAPAACRSLVGVACCASVASGASSGSGVPSDPADSAAGGGGAFAGEASCTGHAPARMRLEINTTQYDNAATGRGLLAFVRRNDANTLRHGVGDQPGPANTRIFGVARRHFRCSHSITPVRRDGGLKRPWAGGLAVCRPSPAGETARRELTAHNYGSGSCWRGSQAAGTGQWEAAVAFSFAKARCANGSF